MLGKVHELTGPRSSWRPAPLPGQARLHSRGRKIGTKATFIGCAKNLETAKLTHQLSSDRGRRRNDATLPANDGKVDSVQLSTQHLGEPHQVGEQVLRPSNRVQPKVVDDDAQPLQAMTLASSVHWPWGHHLQHDCRKVTPWKHGLGCARWRRYAHRPWKGLLALCATSPAASAGASENLRWLQHESTRCGECVRRPSEDLRGSIRWRTAQNWPPGSMRARRCYDRWWPTNAGAGVRPAIC
eukprot:2625892-Pyramimonas_sp.AAC.1